MDDNSIKLIAKAIEAEYNKGLALLRLKRLELQTISNFRQSKAVRHRRRNLIEDLNELQEKLRDKFEQLQSVKNKLEAPAE